MTDVTPPPQETGRAGLSVRSRLTLALALMVAAAVACAGVFAYAVESQRRTEAAVAAGEQELAEFGALQRNGVDPATGESFTGVEPLIRTYLNRNVPNDDELLIGWWDDRPRARSAGNSRVLSEPEFRDFLAEHVAAGGTRTYSSPTAGDLVVSFQPIQAPTGDGALVVVTYLAQIRENLTSTMRTYALVSLVLLLLTTAFAAWLSGRLLAPLRTLGRTAREITTSDLSRRLPLSGNDDITSLTRDVNGMLDRLDAGFESQRRFLDDAGHELRTPLTVLAGHLELLDIGDPDEIGRTRTILLDEVDRMSRLVDDLILLAKSRRPDFVRRSPVDVDILIHDVAAKATALGERDWRVHVRGAGTVAADEQRLTQAMLQLADNAVKHTEPGSRIEIGAAVTHAQVRLWIADDGAGVPVAQRERIFGRFARADVPDGDEGFGLGLSIVRAIALAHGGRVFVEDAGVPSGTASGAHTGDQPEARTGTLSGARFEIVIPREEPTWHTS